MKMAEISPNRYETLWEKEKLLVSVFKGLVLQSFFWEKVKSLHLQRPWTHGIILKKKKVIQDKTSKMSTAK